jgi:3-dehydroquinate dehydratase-2
MPRLLILQGANLNWLGRREPELYGTTTSSELDARLRDYASARNFEIEIVYTNLEGEAIDRLYAAAMAGNIDVVVMNPGGFSYSGYALRDCVKSIKIPVVEVHLTNHYARDIHSVSASAARGILMGFGINTYFRAVDAALDIAVEISRKN